MILPKRRSCLAKRLDEMIKDEDLAISPRALTLLHDLLEEWASLDRRIGAYDDELAALTREGDMARRLATIPGIATINATALVTAVGDAYAFAKGRDLAAWLGLTPRQLSTGGKSKLMGISKRGNKYDPWRASRLGPFHEEADSGGAWVRELLTRAHPNVVIVALAAKLARIV